LYEALKRLRSSNHQYLWVDQICINQANCEEKNSQVQLMSKIYSSAETVLVWLGEKESSTNKDRKHLTRVKSTNLIDNENTAKSHLAHNSFLHHLSSSYWSRLWVIQELISSQQTQLLLDKEEIAWEKFWARIWNEASRLPGFPDQLTPDQQRALRFYSLIASSSAIKLAMKDPTLLTLDPSLPPLAWAEFRSLISFARTLHSSDERDRIYSWFGLIRALGMNMPPPNYASSVTEVFREARRALSNGNFSIVLGGTEEKWSLVNKGGISSSLNTGSYEVENVPTPIIELGGGNTTDEDSISETSSDSQMEMEFQVTIRKQLGHAVTEQKQLLLQYAMTQIRNIHADGMDHKFRKNRSVQAKPAATDSPEHEDTSSSRNQGKQRSRKQESGSASASGLSRKRLSFRDEEQDDDDVKQPPRKQLKDNKPGTHGRSLACPYHQRNSISLHLNSSCRGPGFPDIARLKYVNHFS
jgi:hypothetical protein